MSEQKISPFPLTDAGNAERFAANSGDSFAYIPGRGWHVFDGKRWKADTTEVVVRAVRDSARSILLEAAAATDRNRAATLADWAVKSESSAKIEATMRLARPELAKPADAFDADPWLFNLQNGTMDLRTGELRPHNAADFIMKLSPVVFDLEAASPLFESVLVRAFNRDRELIEYVVRVLGMCLSGDISEQVLVIAHGDGANGKSTILNSAMHVMGDYAVMAPDSLLTLSKRQEHPTELAGLVGTRLVIASETEGNARLKLQLVKKLTGEKRLRTRLMHGNFFEFNRTFKPILQTNNRPKIGEDTEAAWRRIRLVPFNVIIPPEERDTHLAEKLEAEAAGIFNMLLAGCRRWLRDGLGLPAAVQAATKAYRSDEDPIAVFVAECCVLAPKGWSNSGDLLDAYARFCQERGDTPVNSKVFSERLAKHGCKAMRRHAGRGWQGIVVNGAVVTDSPEVGGVVISVTRDASCRQKPYFVLNFSHRAFYGKWRHEPSRDTEQGANKG